MIQKPAFEAIAPDFGNSFKYNKYDANTMNHNGNWHFHPEIELVYINGGSVKRQIGSHVSYFTDGKVEATELGRFLAEEFSYYLSELNPGNYTVIDRTKLEQLFEEQGLNRDYLIDPLSSVKLGRLKGMQHILYGTIIDSGEFYTIYVKLLKVETLEILANSRGRISKVPSLPKHLK